MTDSGVTAADAELDAELDGALQGLRDVLGADGYRLECTDAGDHGLVVTVVAGPGACADCLVPRPVMEGILADALQTTPWTVSRVEMPADAG